MLRAAMTRSARAVVSLAVVLGASACPLPEERFRIQGAVNFLGEQGNLEVTLYRNAVASRLHCDQLEPFMTTRTDSLGHYEFEVLRQQATLGVAERRFFRVEVVGDPREGTLSETFWFPDGDIDLGTLAVPAGITFQEARLDGAISWRSQRTLTFDRTWDERTVTATRHWHEVPLDSLGRSDYVPVETRREFQWQQRNPGQYVPKSRNARCPGLEDADGQEVTPCPLTDGRYVPMSLPENTRALVLDFGREVRVRNITLHGVLTARSPTRLRLEWTPLPDFSWNPFGEPEVNTQEFELSRETCLNPGAFVNLTSVAQTFGSPWQLRIGLQDDEGALIPIVSVAEVVAD